MTALQQALAPLGSRHGLAGNAPRRFDEPGRAALVLNGRVELFLVALSDGDAVGSRHHFATVPEGGLILGIDSAQVGLGLCLLAVGPIGTEILEIAPAAIEGLATTPEGAALVAPAMDLWVQALMRGMAQWVSPRPDIDHQLTPGDVHSGFGPGADAEPNRLVVSQQSVNASAGSVQVPVGRRLTVRGGVAWVRVSPSDCLLLDMQELGEESTPCLFPLSPDGWLMALQDQAVTAIATPLALRDGTAWTGLAALHRLLFEIGLMNLRLADVDEHNRLRARVAATNARRLQGLGQLRAAVDVRSEQVAPPLNEPPLVAALRLIGQEQGFAVRLPPNSAGDEAGEPPSLADLVRASGLRLRAVNLRSRWWRADFGTLLGFDRESGQPLVLRLDGRGQPKIIDPADPAPRAFATERERLADTAYQLSGSLPARPIGYRDLFGFGLLGRAPDLTATLATGFMLGLLGMAIPVAAGLMIDQVIPDHEVGRLIEMGLLLAVLGLTGFVLTYVNLLGYARIEAHLGRALQAGLMDRLLRLPLGFFQRYSAGELATRVGAISLIQSLISMASANAILSGVFSVFSFLLMFLYDLRLALWASLAVLVYVIGSALLLARRLRQERPLATINGEINSTLLQLILGVTKIRLAAAEDRAFARWAELFALGRRRRISAEQLGAIQATLNEVFALSGLVLFVLAIGKPSETDSLVALGAFAALLIAFQRFAAGMTEMTQVLTQLLAIQPQLERARPLLEACPEVVESREPPGQISGALEISNARFRYSPEGPLILDDVSLKAAPGEMIAIVGPSGSGKSTLMRLLLGFETLETGAILIDGKELSRLDAVAVRRQMGVVLQGAQPLPGSLFENIVGAVGGNLDDAWEAAERVGLAADIREMPMGMQSVILEGGNSLSGGQLQRLMIARAIVGRPRILLLDEATSALDNRIQAVVTESLERLSVTRVVVAHRLSTVINADRIYVLEQGRLVETGTYAELMAAGGAFAQLAERQRL
jgi:ATP-binding cassette subfamily C protein